MPALPLDQVARPALCDTSASRAAREEVDRRMKTIHCPICDKSRPQAGSTVRFFLGLRRRVCGKCGVRK